MVATEAISSLPALAVPLVLGLTASRTVGSMIVDIDLTLCTSVGLSWGNDLPVRGREKVEGCEGHKRVEWKRGGVLG